MARAPENSGFPFVQRFKDFGGVVVYALDVKPGGAFANPRVLATAPHAEFAEATDSAIRSWRWKLEGSAQPPSCRMPDVHVLTFEFALGR